MDIAKISFLEDFMGFDDGLFHVGDIYRYLGFIDNTNEF